MNAVILALAAGAVIGLALGALGGGGSVLAVPALIYLLGFTPVAATTASLVIVAVTSAAALSAHARDGHVRWRTGLLFAAAGVGLAMLGGAVAGRLPEAALTAAFGVVAAAAALRMLRLRPTPDAAASDAAAAAANAPDVTAAETAASAATTSDTAVPDTSDVAVPDTSDTAVPDTSDVAAPIRPGKAAAAGAGLGAVTGVLGVGGGFLAVPALAGVLGMRMRSAVATSLLVITVNSVAALATRAGTVEGLDWAVVGPFAGAAILAAWDGKRLAAKVSGHTLQRIFAVVLLVVAAFMLIDAATGSGHGA
ncbi:sulfite exporter TauE/SafE family protein [Streptomyces sp. HNM0663]|uniref:Probable membrane transporter protein n=1 Tax=Streptomyces chengmaiensis TaxID=3040919 RepID=A0ABT6HF81_9ACTN|nr:sulfite exporter TauE/SafE family protein [Streptomyces chengmaiensis]MDH2387418.1 sulfite exporter TauE/SafE family protein [Streptomyces chengmaiensis]